MSSGSGNVKGFVGQSKAYNAVSRLFSKKKTKVYSGRGEEFSYWKRYLMQAKAKVRGPEIWRPLVGYKKPFTHEWYYDDLHPQTFQSAGRQALEKMPLVKPIKEWSIFLGDKVEVLVGKDKGKIGEVVEIFKERNWCFVEGLHTNYTDASLNKVKPHLRGVQAIHAFEKPLLVTHEVKLIDPADQCATEFEWRYSEDGERVRVSVRTGRVIPIPHCHKNTWEDHTRAWEVKHKLSSLGHGVFYYPRRYIGFLHRKGTKAACKLPMEYNNMKEFLARVRDTMSKYSIPEKLVINFDQTNISIIPCGNWTMAQKGASIKDTTAANLQQVTYQPKLCRFEEDIAESMGLTLKAREKQSYWY